MHISLLFNPRIMIQEKKHLKYSGRAFLKKFSKEFVKYLLCSRYSLKQTTTNTGMEINTECPKLRLLICEIGKS